MAIRLRHRKYDQEVQGRSLTAMNPAWAVDRPLPVPSNQWVDADVRPTYEAEPDPIRLRGRGGESGMNLRSL